MKNTDLSALVKAIITGQSRLIGPLAIEQANKVQGLQVSSDLMTITTNGETVKLLTDLVKKYEELFGKTSIEVCKDAVKEISSMIPVRELPPILQ